jgi:hypothetical protein
VAIDTLITHGAVFAPWVEDGAEVLSEIVAVVLVIPIASISGFFTVEPHQAVVLILSHLAYARFLLRLDE